MEGLLDELVWKYKNDVKVEGIGVICFPLKPPFDKVSPWIPEVRRDTTATMLKPERVSV